MAALQFRGRVASIMGHSAHDRSCNLDLDWRVPRWNLLAPLRRYYMGGRSRRAMSGSSSGADAGRLSSGEIELLQLIARGADEEEFALRTGLGGNDAQAAIKAILRKLGARNRTEAIIAAHEAGYL